MVSKWVITPIYPIITHLLTIYSLPGTNHLDWRNDGRSWGCWFSSLKPSNWVRVDGSTMSQNEKEPETYGFLSKIDDSRGVPTLPETNSLQLKMDGWNTRFRLGPGLFSGAMLVLGSVIVSNRISEISRTKRRKR